MLEAWSYDTISKLSSPKAALFSVYVSDKHIISHLCMELYLIKSDILMKLCVAMLFKFQG